MEVASENVLWPVVRRRCSYRYCEHCDREVSIRVYKEHKRLYYDTITKSWTKDRTDPSPSSSELSAIESEMDIESEEDPVLNWSVESECLEWGDDQKDDGDDGMRNKMCEDLPCQGLFCCLLIVCCIIMYFT